MTATPGALRTAAARLRRGVGQLEILAAIIEAADGPWLGAMDSDGRGTAELRMHLAGKYRFTAVVTSAGKLSLAELNSPGRGKRAELVLSTKAAQRKGWDAHKDMPKPQEWVDYVVGWVRAASAAVGRRDVVEWLLRGADQRLAAMNDSVEAMRAALAEREQMRDELAAEVAELRAELEAESALADKRVVVGDVAPDGEEGVVVEGVAGEMGGGAEAGGDVAGVEAGADEDQVADPGFVAGPGGGLDGDVAADHVQHELSRVVGDGEGQHALGAEQAGGRILQ